MGKILYVGNLDWTITESNLKDAFSQVGEVINVKVAINKKTGRSDGHAYVEMGTEEEAQTAISKFNGTRFEKRNILVSVYNPMGPRGDRGGFKR